MNDHHMQGRKTGSEPPRLFDLAREAIRRRHYSYRTEEIYTHVMNKGGRGVKSPLDRAEQRVAEYCAG